MRGGEEGVRGGYARPRRWEVCEKEMGSMQGGVREKGVGEGVRRGGWRLREGGGSSGKGCGVEGNSEVGVRSGWRGVMVRANGGFAQRVAGGWRKGWHVEGNSEVGGGGAQVLSRPVFRGGTSPQSFPTCSCQHQRGKDSRRGGWVVLVARKNSCADYNDHSRQVERRVRMGRRVADFRVVIASGERSLVASVRINVREES